MPEGGLLVQSGLDSTPVALSAIRFDVPDNVEVDVLRLVPSNSADLTLQPSLRACPAEPEFDAAHGGALVDAPGYDCSTAVGGVWQASGFVEFSVGPLVQEHRLTVVIVPASGGERVVFEEPDQRAIVARPVSTSTPSTTAAPVTMAPVAPTPGGTGVGAARPASARVPPTPAEQPTTSALGAPAPSTAPVSLVESAETQGDGGTTIPALAVAALLVGGVGLWLFSGGQRAVAPLVE